MAIADERPKKKKKKPRSRRALVLGVGLIVVVAILVIVMMVGGGGRRGGVAKDPPLEQDFSGKKATGGVPRSLERPEIENNLRQLGLAFTLFELDHQGRGPNDQKEFERYYDRVRIIQDSLTHGWITFPWGVGKGAFPDGRSNTVLAYETHADELGNRFVVMGDGSVQCMGKGEFRRRPKVQGK